MKRCHPKIVGKNENRCNLFLDGLFKTFKLFVLAQTQKETSFRERVSVIGQVTLPKTNIAPPRRPFQKVTHFPTPVFQGVYSSLPRPQVTTKDLMKTGKQDAMKAANDKLLREICGQALGWVV